MLISIRKIENCVKFFHILCGIKNKQKIITEVCLKFFFFFHFYDRIKGNFRENCTYIYSVDIQSAIITIHSESPL